MEQKYKKPGEDDNGFDVGFKRPEIKGIVQSAQKTLFAQHQKQAQDEEEAEKQGKPVKKRQKPKGGTICCCGDPNCGIGPMVERQE